MPRDKPVSLTLTIPAVGLTALATGNLDAARSNGLIAEGDESQLASLFSVLQPGDRGFNIVEP
jgi:alkyl sulfatase BDS1-like metallo-beta-lactamase superfamily hydrolase